MFQTTFRNIRQNNFGGLYIYCHSLFFLPELVSALRGLLEVVMALEHVGDAGVPAAAAAAKAARFCIALRPRNKRD